MAGGRGQARNKTGDPAQSPEAFSLTPPPSRPPSRRRGAHLLARRQELNHPGAPDFLLGNQTSFSSVPGMPKYLSVDRLRVRRQDLPRRGTPELGSSGPGLDLQLLRAEEAPESILSKHLLCQGLSENRGSAWSRLPGSYLQAHPPPCRAQLVPVKEQGRGTEIPDRTAGLPWVRGVEG